MQNTLYRIIKSLCCIPETNAILFANYNSTKNKINEHKITLFK